MSLSSHLQELKKKHQTLSDHVEVMQRAHGVDDLELAKLKKKKLQIKEEITRLATHLIDADAGPWAASVNQKAAPSLRGLSSFCADCRQPAPQGRLKPLEGHKSRLHGRASTSSGAARGKPQGSKVWF